MRRLRSMSSALAWVKNGRAMAPPAWGWRIGVSTSRKSSATSSVPHGGHGLEPDPEHPSGVLVGQQVDLALAVPHLRLAQAVPLVRQGPERLGQHLQIGERRPRARLGGSRSPRRWRRPSRPRSDLSSTAAAVVGEIAHRDQQLNGSGDVLQGDEDQLAVAPHAGDPSRPPARLRRSGRRRPARRTGPAIRRWCAERSNRDG